VSIKRISFIGSAASAESCPADALPEIAFTGRSNVGKSSLINMLTSRRGIARVSAIPGKTRLINHFLADASWYLVDLPGYGYAQISRTEQKKIRELVHTYLLHRKQLRYVFLLVDSRIPPQQIDLRFMEWLRFHAISFIILFTKTDKLSGTELRKNLSRYQRILRSHWEVVPVIIPTSAKTRTGKDEVLGIISEIVEGKIGN
jgi:GTP-binding protein